MSFDASLDPVRMPIVEQLAECAQRSYAPFHTPGHKRGQGLPPQLLEYLGRSPFAADLPELPELDNLFAPEGVIQEAQILAAKAFGADRTWFLANGSTAGILAAILATCCPGDQLILPRNVHRSAISGLILTGVQPIFVLPEQDPVENLSHSVTPEAIEAAIKANPQAKAALIVSPTYYGACGDVASIAEVVHRYGLVLIVDEAHGAHFAFHPALPTPALSAGADLAIQSTHKTLAALTQASMLHLKGDRVDPDRISQGLQLVQSTSPNYLLLASLDAARMQMATQGEMLLEQAIKLADNARSRIAKIAGLYTIEPSNPPTPGFWELDRTRLTVSVRDLGIDGFTADEILNETLGVTCELPSLQHLSFIITHGNSPEDIDRLVSALETLARDHRQPLEFTDHPATLPPLSPILLTPRDAFFAPSVTVPLADAIGLPSAELLCPYPPGIPVLMPGEQVTAEAIDYLQHIKAAGGVITGCSDPELQTLRVIPRSVS